MSKIVDYHKRFTNNTNRWVSFDSTQSLWLSHLSAKAFLGKSLGFMHVLIQRPSIIGESMFISSVVAFRSRSSDYKFPPARSINRSCNATHGEYGCEDSRDELWRSQVERWSWLLVGDSPPSSQICRVVHGWYVSWEARVGLWIWLDLQEGSSWRHRVLQAVRMPERVDADSGPRRVRVRRVIHPWRSVALESLRAELERTIYYSWKVISTNFLLTFLTFQTSKIFDVSKSFFKVSGAWKMHRAFWKHFEAFGR